MVNIKSGNQFVITTKPIAGSPDMVSTDYAELPSLVNIGDLLLLNDGALELQVESITDTEVVARENVGGDLPARKGINIQSLSIDLGGITS